VGQPNNNFLSTNLFIIRMKKNLIWLIVIILLISVIRIINRRYFDEWSGIGLIISILLGAIIAIAGYFFIFKQLPRNKNDAKEFKLEGIFNPLFGVIVFLMASLLMTLGYVVGNLPLIMPIIVWVITLIYLFYWIKVRKSPH